jgi:hypothetical protein
MEKSSPKIWRLLCFFFKKAAQSKQLPNWWKFAQYGHPVDDILLPTKVQEQLKGKSWNT